MRMVQMTYPTLYHLVVFSNHAMPCRRYIRPRRYSGCQLPDPFPGNTRRVAKPPRTHAGRDYDGDGFSTNGGQISPRACRAPALRPPLYISDELGASVRA